MKTAAKIYLAALIGAGILPAMPSSAQVLGEAAAGVGAMAQEQANVQAQAGQVQSQTQAQLQAQAQMQAAGSAPVLTPPPVQTATGAAALPPVATPGMGTAMPAPTAVNAASPPALDAEEDTAEPSAIKVPKSVTNAVKKLDNATDKVTLDDLNSAREAVAKLDVLLDIEKRLSDLATIRRERDEKNGMASAIPASSFGMPPMMAGRGGPPPSYPPAGMDNGMSAAPPMMMNSDPEVNRIMGANGRYVALIKGPDGKNQRIHEGDKLPDGSLVETISSQGLTVVQGKTKRTVRVKDSGTVFGGR